MAVKIIFFKKNTTILQKHLLYYFYQLVIIMMLTLISSGVTYLIQPVVYHQFEKAGQAKPAITPFKKTRNKLTTTPMTVNPNTHILP